MPRTKTRVHKHYQLEAAKIQRAQRVLGAKSETETIERALDFTIAEHEKNRLAWQATERFLRSGVVIDVVYGVTEGY